MEITYPDEPVAFDSIPQVFLCTQMRRSDSRLEHCVHAGIRATEVPDASPGPHKRHSPGKFNEEVAFACILYADETKPRVPDFPLTEPRQVDNAVPDGVIIHRSLVAKRRKRFRHRLPEAYACAGRPTGLRSAANLESAVKFTPVVKYNAPSSMNHRCRASAEPTFRNLTEALAQKDIHSVSLLCIHYANRGNERSHARIHAFCGRTRPEQLDRAKQPCRAQGVLRRPCFDEIAPCRNAGSGIAASFGNPNGEARTAFGHRFVCAALPHDGVADQTVGPGVDYLNLKDAPGRYLRHIGLLPKAGHLAPVDKDIGNFAHIPKVERAFPRSPQRMAIACPSREIPQLLVGGACPVDKRSNCTR